ncbi:hypothetical protein H072_6606 [Dactylellina haptotyla CBS 200.50]|uniref:Uncharacterized protein n=1 Tax=Dactylellina haptotyla (strain CBS 200.50) TaxID=1284197 RepID=S8A8Y8_DACHA|nr:hypothetical protein H072_6606 [Dactylellina haptotyla CBS 200.50]
MHDGRKHILDLAPAQSPLPTTHNPDPGETKWMIREVGSFLNACKKRDFLIPLSAGAHARDNYKGSQKL